MFKIILHSSKTMRPRAKSERPYHQPAFLTSARELMARLKALSPKELQTVMNISESKAAEVYDLTHAWTDTSQSQTPAIDAFSGDIYSGLQAHSMSEADRQYAHDHLIILSGLYGVLRALDSISPYRLEMGYKLPPNKATLYEFWGDRMAGAINESDILINTSSQEYTKALLPHINNRVITPVFLTEQVGKRKTVAVHSKIARGAYARWMIKNRVMDDAELTNFAELNYKYHESSSKSDSPVFITTDFGGRGLSVR